MKTPKVHYVSLVWPPYRAMTVPPFGIFIKKKFRSDEKILNHELVHWKQYQERGLFNFYFCYFSQKLKMGYDKMPMELEARYEEKDYARENYSKVYLK